MCGILAILGSEPITAAAVQPALASLRHRGPDGAGSWVSPDGCVALGHARLSIMDLVGGAQPLASEDGRVVASVNGEFYGWEALRRELERKGHRFRTRSDSEILVHLYEQHGLACLDQLRGEFAFALWDQRQRRLLLARDRWGIKPLCWTQHAGRVLAASEAKALFALGAPVAWDAESLFQSLQVQYTAPDRTLFRGIHQLPPGHFLLADAEGVRVRPYWDFDYPLKVGQSSSRAEADYIAELREHLDEAVRLRLQADVPVAFHLSGGLDSSAVVGLAARRGVRPLDCFTLSFPASSHDELGVAAQTAQAAGAKLHAVRITDEALLEVLPEAAYHAEGLTINGHLPSKFLLSRAIRDAGYKVVLTGEGSDEVLAGYAHLRLDRLRQLGAEGERLHSLTGSNTASAGVMLPSGAALPTDAVARALGWVPGWMEAKATLGHRLRPLLSREFLHKFHDRDPFEELLRPFDLQGQLRGRARVDQALYLWNRSALSNYILRTLGDGTEMAHGIEGRLPFLDGVLFEFLRRVPRSLLLQDGIEKRLLREAVKPWLTETVYRREKHPLLAPPLSRFASPDVGNRVREILSDPVFGALSCLDPSQVLRWFDQLEALPASERAAADPVLWTLLSLSALHQQFRPAF